MVTATVAMEWSAKTICNWRETKDKQLNQMTSNSCTSIPVPVKWTKPNVGVLKLNVDAAVRLEAASFSIGLVI